MQAQSSLLLSNAPMAIPARFKIAALVLVLSVPFIQLGLGVYVSISFGAALIAFIVGGFSVVRNSSLLVASIPLALGYVIKVATALLGSIELLELLVIFRELACYIVFISIVQIVERVGGQWDSGKNLLVGLYVVTCAFGGFQALLLLRGKYVGIPAEYFVINQGTLEGLEDLIANGYRFRATGFYGEPSYLAYVVMSLLAVVVCSYKSISLQFKAGYILTAVAVSTSAQSVSGILAIGVWVVIWIVSIWKELPALLKLLFPTSLILASVGIAIYFGEEIGTRYEAIIDGNDESFGIRLEEPFRIIASMDWIETLIGVVGIRDVQIDNGILSLYIRYGLISFLIMFSLAAVARNVLAISYLFLAFNFNGAILAYDKVVIFGIAVGAMRLASQKRSLKNV